MLLYIILICDITLMNYFLPPITNNAYIYTIIYTLFILNHYFRAN